MARRMRDLAAIAAGVASFTALSATPAFGATIPVNTTGDVVDPGDNLCSLREAVNSANTDTVSGVGAQECPAGSGADVIQLNAAATYALTLTADGDLPISTDITIDGIPGTKIDANTATPLGDRLFDITGTPSVHITDVELTGGRAKADQPGGAIRQAGGTLTIDRSTLRDNAAGHGTDHPGTGSTDGGTGGDGGAVYTAAGTLIITSTTLTQNRAGGGGLGSTTAGGSGRKGGAGGRGGAIYAVTGSLTVADSTISDNDAGLGGSPGTTISVGFPGTGGAGGSGGGVFVNGPASFTSTTITGNDAGDGWRDASAANPPMTFNPTTGGAGGDGGGVAGTGTSGLSFTNVTVAGNTAGNGGQAASIPGQPGNGGGIHSDATVGVSLDRTTVSGNSAGDGTTGAGGDSPGGSGGGIWSDSQDSELIRNSTLSGNHAGAGGNTAPDGVGGAYYVNQEPPEFTDSTIASNTVEAGAGGGAIDGPARLHATIVSGNGPNSCFGGTVTDLGSNIAFQDDSCPGAHVDPLLGPLANNGGPTKTHALLTGSPALDAAGAGPCLRPTDQRGITRPQGSACDIGAFELEVVPPQQPQDPGNPGGDQQQQDQPQPQQPQQQNPTGPGPDLRPPTLGLTLPRQTLPNVLRGGYAADVTSDEAGTALLEVFVDSRVLKPAARTRIGHKSIKLTAGRRTRIRAKLSRVARTRLRGRKSVTAVIRVTVTDAANNKTVQNKKVKLKAR